MKYSKIYLLLLFSISIASCEDDIDSKTCDNSSSEFQSIFQSLVSNGHTDTETYDSEIHEYSFSLTSNKDVCKIGYQSQPAMSSTDYIIEIVDNSTGSIIYSDNHRFSSTQTSYITPSSPINLKSGVSYTVRRIQTLWGNNIGNTIGRIAMKHNMSFPYSNGIMTITGSKFYQNGGPSINGAVPYIDLILI